jgi:hypothetical protein
MNIFCHPGVTQSRTVALKLGFEVGEVPEFGFPARVPLEGERVDRTEVDMKFRTLLAESKLTETHFQVQRPAVVESYRDFRAVFDCDSLPRLNDQYVSYQLIRNVLAAYHHGLSFCVLHDERRPDLREAWFTVMRCVRITDLRTKCKVLTWQELAEVLPEPVQDFLDRKYGIVLPAAFRVFVVQTLRIGARGHAPTSVQTDAAAFQDTGEAGEYPAWSLNSRRAYTCGFATACPYRSGRISLRRQRDRSQMGGGRRY